MLCPEEFYRALRNNRVDFFTGVPDSLLKSLCAFIQDNVPKQNHIIAANEGGALALAIGYHFATGKTPLVYMQNSGLGNIVNPLLSLADPEIYAVPMLLVIGWRGQPGVKDEPQHVKQGRVMLDMLNAMEIPFLILSKDTHTASSQLQEALAIAEKQSRPVALVVEKDTFADYQIQTSAHRNEQLTREEAIESVINTVSVNTIVVATTGMASRELFELRKKQGHLDAPDFLTIGGMGHASQIALGIALQQPNKQVLCLDGDGATLMHMGAMAIIGQQSCTNFIHIIINNGAHDSVGGQPTVASFINLPEIAKACGYTQVAVASTALDIVANLNMMQNKPGRMLLEIKTQKGHRKDLGRPTSTPAENKHKLMSFVQCI